MLLSSSSFPMFKKEKSVKEDEVITSEDANISTSQIGELYFFISLYPLNYLTDLINSLMTNGKWSDV